MSLTILCIEDNKLVAAAIRDLLAAEGWTVEVCADGYTALNRLASAVSYDLLILDNGLPNVSGLELTRYARKLPHSRHIPIIMFSADELEDEARSAGVDLFLRKPHEISLLVDAVRRLT
jgi:CheY-like chemotaxis protein